MIGKATGLIPALMREEHGRVTLGIRSSGSVRLTRILVHVATRDLPGPRDPLYEYDLPGLFAMFGVGPEMEACR